jgi:glycosyltransferase involved in cell wall biosynthesis
MVELLRTPSAHVLVFEPRVEGHHLGYLKAIAEEFLGAGYRLTLAIDTRAGAFAAIRAEFAGMLDRVTVLPAHNPPDARKDRLVCLATLAAQSTADLVFLPNLDEIGSTMMRRAALGLSPPAVLRGRLCGIYFRPRFLGRLGLSPNQWLKALGFRRLLRDGWFSLLLLPDPYLQAALKARAPHAPAVFLPDFFPEHFVADRNNARQALGLPPDARAFLFYGAGYRRKGLGLAVRAMLPLDRSSPAFLLCAGRHKADRETRRGLARLTQEGRARVIDRYITDEEEKQLFAAGDVVLLPYRRHFGSSGVLVRAIGAGLPVIASDEELIGRLVRERGLGIVFRPGDAAALRQAIDRAARASQQEMAGWRAAALKAAPDWSRQAFRAALLGGVEAALGRLNPVSTQGATGQPVQNQKL